MIARFVAAALLAGAALAGCCGPDDAATGAAALSDAGHGVHLFGPTPLAVGHEHLGYFAYVEPVEPPLAMFDHHTVFVRTRSWDVENNRRSDLSYHRRRTFSEETRFGLR
jgi:hypothetical protein